jgi:hypothetical protein
MGWGLHLLVLYMVGEYKVLRGDSCSMVALVGMVCMIANEFSNAKVFSLVNELRIIKKVNLLKISTSLHGWYYDIKIDLGV